MGILLLAMIWFAVFKGVPIMFGWQWLLIPVLMLLMAGIGLGTGIIISSLTTKYRDFTILISFAVQLLMYATPVAYPLSYLQNKSFAPLIQWNPLSAVVEGFRYALFHTGSFEIASLAYSACFMIVVLLFGIVYFNRVERSFMDTV